MLTDDCKEELYPTIETFEDGYRSIIFSNKRISDISSFASEKNGIINMGPGDNLTKQDFASQFVELVNNYELRMEMHDKMNHIDLKHGFENIKSVVQEEYVKFELNR
jgi:hypothetical protein